MLSLSSFGEMLIDFISSDGINYIKKAGGAPANVAAGFARLGGNASFIGKAGADPFGSFLKETLTAAEVNTDGFILDDSAKTSLAFVSLNKSGEREFFFVREPGADTLLREEEVDFDRLKGAGIFHYGSISLISNPTGKTLVKLLNFAKKEGIITSYDPNLRLNLWQTPEEARRKITEVLSYADLVKLAEDELYFIAQTDNREKALSTIADYGVDLIFVTRGEKGAFCLYKGTIFEEEGFKVHSVDTTGAGDGFMAAILYKLALIGGCSELTTGQIEDMLSFANRAGAIVTTRYGAISSMPSTEEIFKIAQTSYSSPS